MKKGYTVCQCVKNLVDKSKNYENDKVRNIVLPGVKGTLMVIIDVTSITLH